MPDCAPINPIAIRVESGPQAARTALEALFSKLAPLELDSEDTGRIELVLAEVLNNISEHAYPDGGPQGPITLDCRLQKGALYFNTTDQGRPMPAGELPTGAPANLNVDLEDLPEGGFGWFLIRDMTEEIAYNRTGSQNQLSFAIKLSVSRQD